MSNQYGPRIVTDGLVLCLDAANRKSYPGTGTTWTDLSGNGYNGSLVNGVGYNSENKGSLSFDGANDYVITSRPSSITTGGNMSICMYAKWNTKTWTGNYSTDLQALIDNNHDNTNGFVIQDRPDLTNAPLDTVGGLTSTFKVGDGNWHFIAITLLGTTESKMYIDGILNVSNTGFGIGTVQPNISIGYWQRFPGRYFNGLIPQVLIYNRTLSSSEIRQNFEATKGRYGL